MSHIYDQYRCVDDIDFKHAKIVYQGVEGAYSQQAMFLFFGEDCDSFHVDTFGAAVRAISRGEADYAVLPVENSIAGIVSENFDLLAGSDNCVIAEQRLPIHHCLLGTPDSEMADIREVFSHPQALRQCAEYLKSGGWKYYESRNTAMAAKRVKEAEDKTQAAIAGRVTAEIYGLKILEEDIEDVKHNTTRFVILSREKVYRRDAEMITICFELPDESGSLYKILSHFYFNGLNMASIQSRPIPDKNWQYRFYIDFAGNMNDENVQKALRRLEEDTLNLQLLGTF